MQLLQNINVDWVGPNKRKIYLVCSLLMLGISLVSLLFLRGLPLGVDFKGGTLVYVKFTETPNEDQIRTAVQNAGLKGARIQRVGAPGENQVIVALEQAATSEEALDRGKLDIIKALQALGQQPEGKQDLNNIGPSSLQQYLLNRDPLRAGTDAGERYMNVARAITQFRDTERGGVLRSVDEIRGVADPAVLAAMQQDFFTSNFSVRNVEIVGPQVGAQLRQQAVLATIYSCLGMLVYLWFRFELIYGAAAVLAVVHDTTITLGVFSLLGTEISLTVIAAILTLIGYSMNDTIVIFDRVRENLKLLRREKLQEVVNISINQTMSRTILTSGLTFLTVLSLFLFGGEVLYGFSLALVVGILIGTYSSIAVAAPVMLVYQQWRAGRSGRAASAAPARADRRDKVRV